MRGGVAGAAGLLVLAIATTCVGPARAVTTINVEIDYMADGTHSHQPSTAEMNAVVQMFACHGITLNYVIDQQVPELALMTDGPDPRDFFTATGPGTFQSYRSQFFGHAGQPGWHYCIFGHNYQEDGGGTNSSGLAQRPGFNFVVTLGSAVGGVGTSFDRAATFAHELGHNLGLTHAGTQDEAVVGKFKPVYASIMSYMFQLRGVKTQLACLGLSSAYHRFKDLDYSDGRLPNVAENALDEGLGAGMHPVDWNCNGSVAGVVAQDLDDPDNDGRWCDAGGAFQVVSDTDDWAAVLASSEPNLFTKVWDGHEQCISPNAVLRTSAASNCSPAQPTLVSESCRVGDMVFVDPANGGTQTGAGATPFNSFPGAYSGAATQSVIYFRPGTYHSGSGVLNKPLTLAGPQPFTIVP
jgi:hypothetical protein